MSWERRLRLVPSKSLTKVGFTDVVRTLITAIVGVVATIVVSVMIIGIAAVRPTSPLLDRITKAWANLILTAAGVKIETHGTEGLDPEEAYVIILNHRSAFDIMCLFVALPLPIRFLAKQELFSIPLFGTMLRSLRMVPINRTAANHPAINAASGNALGQGYSLVVFAEGTRVPSADAKAFKKGGFIIAQQHNAPILPIAMVGTGHILAPRGRIVRRANVSVVIADPIPSASVGSQSIDELVSTTRTIVLNNERHWESRSTSVKS